MNFIEKIDYSSLSTYMTCPRKFLFQYVFHLSPDGKSINLVFGSCWHYGLEKTYNLIKQNPSLLKSLDATVESIKAFNKLWDLDGAPTWKNEDVIFPKSPGHAANMYRDYWERFLKLDGKKKVVAVEAPFVIDLSVYKPGLPNYIGRIDLILGDGDGIEIVDHKTAKAIYKITPQGFEVSFQTDGYLTAGRLYYDKIPKITYRVALCQKSKIDFQPITINKRAAAIDHFLANLVYYIEKIQDDLTLLEQDMAECTGRTDVLKSFPRCPGTACTTYMAPCPYYDLCMLRNNPIAWKDKAPQGFTFKEWDPDQHDANMRQRLGEA